MADYTKAQSAVIALWVLARSKNVPEAPIPAATAPELITDIVNQLGPSHTSDSVLLHKHGYDRLLLDRKIDKTITSLQREIAGELCEANIIAKVFDV